MQALSSYLVTGFQIMAKEAINVLYVPFVGLAVYCDRVRFLEVLSALENHL